MSALIRLPKSCAGFMAAGVADVVKSRKTNANCMLDAGAGAGCVMALGLAGFVGPSGGKERVRRINVMGFHFGSHGGAGGRTQDALRPGRMVTASWRGAYWLWKCGSSGA